MSADWRALPHGSHLSGLCVPLGERVTAKPSDAYGVHSEVGKLHKVLVCSPGLAHERLTPTNCDDLLFDDVLWVQNARRDHCDFMDKMRDRDVEVVELHNLLTPSWIPLRRAGLPNCSSVGSRPWICPPTSSPGTARLRARTPESPST